MKAAKNSPPKVPQGTPDHVPVKDLHFDTRNPRLVEYGVTAKTSQDDILEILWEKMAVDEIAMSIAASGFWDYEPLFVVREGGVDVVIEGNRRLAAVKILHSHKLQEHLKATDLPSVSAKDLEKLESLPVIRVEKRADVWPYLGFKHVNGPAKWRSYAKAQYIAFVRKTTGESLEAIAAQIGDRHRTVQRLFRALMVIEQAEKAGVYKRDNAYRQPLNFALLPTALQLDGISEFLGIAEERDESSRLVPRSRKAELGDFCSWLWGNSSRRTKPVVRDYDPDLLRLGKVLGHEHALGELKNGTDLSIAYAATRGRDAMFKQSLDEARSALARAQALVRGNDSCGRKLRALSAGVACMARDLAAVIERNSESRRARRRETQAETL
jgi:hypothetical protein